MVATYLADGTVTGHDTLKETGGVSKWPKKKRRRRKKKPPKWKRGADE
jgi:hypothetical protein